MSDSLLLDCPLSEWLGEQTCCRWCNDGLETLCRPCHVAEHAAKPKPDQLRLEAA